MEVIKHHSWRKLIKQRLAAELEACAIEFNDANIEYIETEMGKIGTISHDEVDINKLQNSIIQLLATSTKDFRLLTHLLNTLQREVQALPIILAITILIDYLELYWNIASPQKLKKRILKLIISRFELIKGDFYINATLDEVNEFKNQINHLKNILQSIYPELNPNLDGLLQKIASKAIASNVDIVKDSIKKPAVQLSNIEDAAQIKESAFTGDDTNNTAGDVVLDSSSKTTWHKSLLKVIAIESSKSKYQPIIFQLRRHIVWSLIDFAPPAHNQITTVPTIGIENIRAYEHAFINPDEELWQKIENTISYSPYWFDGHYMSAQIAYKLGRPILSQVIKHELWCFLERFPTCKELRYSNGEPFANDTTLNWLYQKTENAVNTAHQEALNIYKTGGLIEALNYLEQTTIDEPRLLFHTQLLIIQLLKKSGYSKIAKQQLDTLYNKVIDLSAEHWEPSFFERLNNLKEKINI